jgi:cytochrome c553/uncharacterized protein (DUF302 family)
MLIFKEQIMQYGILQKLLLVSLLLCTFYVQAEGTVKKSPEVAEVAQSETIGEANIEKGAELYKKCALCHGQFGQGIVGGLYPRLAGMPEHYILSQMKKYVDGSRADDFSISMLEVGGMKDMTAQQSKDLAAFLAAIDLDKHYALKIPAPITGDAKNGKKLFKGDCKSCHGKQAQGKVKKDSPPLAGQYSEYLLRETNFFKAKHRHHDNDPEDETFDEYSKKELDDIFAYIATISFKPEKGYPEVPNMPLPTLNPPAIPTKPTAPTQPAAPSAIAGESSGNTEGIKIESVTQTVLKMALKKGVNAEDAIEAMLSKAAAANMKNVGHQPVSKELKARGIDSPRLEIFQFCNPEDAIKMVKFNTLFAAYMPCRIALVEDAKGILWLEMLNLDMLINKVALPPELNQIAIETNGVMLDILTAGATGEF